MWEISENIVFVAGEKNAAIYNLYTGDVYAINSEAKQIVEKLIKKDDINNDEKNYLELLSRNGLIDKNCLFQIKPYVAKRNQAMLKLVWLEITQGCNMHCVHCYEGQEHIVNKNVLSLKQWKTVIDQIIELRVQRVIVIGGEPCIHNGIIDILKYLRSRSATLSITLFTNGYFIDENIFNTVVDNNIEVKVSLYGHNSKVHDQITGVKGSFSKLIKTVIRLANSGVAVNIAITLMKENEVYYDHIREFVRTLPIKGYKFDVIREVVNGTQSTHVPLTTKVKEMAYRKKPNFYVKKQQFDNNVYYNSCWNGKLVVTENGDILPCVFARNHVCGNIQETSISDIIYGEKQLRKYWESTFELVEDCKICEYRYACRDCRPIAESAKGIGTKNPRCKYNPHKGEWVNE